MAFCAFAFWNGVRRVRVVGIRDLRDYFYLAGGRQLGFFLCYGARKYGDGFIVGIVCGYRKTRKPDL